MNQRGFVIIILVVIGIVIIAGAAGYFVINRQIQKPLAPIIKSISPAEAPVGTEILITGSGFTPTKNSLQFGAGLAYINNLASPDGKNIRFTLPESFDTCNPDGTVCAELLSRPVPGKTYEVAVINVNGRSNTVNFTAAFKEEVSGCTNLCGDKICQEVVCMAIGCPCPETSQTCPNDCPILTPSPTPTPNRVPYREDGTCPPGYVNYGMPLQCVTPEYMEYCKTNPCPICLAAETLIDTPLGQVPVKDLQVGMPVWTTDKSGQRVSGIITKTSKVSVPPTHQVVHLILNDGRALFASPGHPTIDGRTVGDFVVNDIYDGASVLAAERIAYENAATYDILPSGKTGFYWANGILLDSTLH